MAKECLCCGKSMGAFSGKVPVSDGYVCTDCWSRAGLETSMNALMASNQYSGDSIRRMVEVKEKNQSLVDNFKPTKVVGSLSFDDNSQTFLVVKSKKNKDLYSYSQIVDFELLEDGESITKGRLGRAVAGGLLFGGVGAIVGGVTGGKKTKSICKSLQIKITFRNSPHQNEYLSFIAAEVKTNSFVYKTAYKSAQDALSALQVAVDSANASNSDAQQMQAVSGADEILKYKNLLDSGIITEEEFNAKKAQLLGL